MVGGLSGIEKPTIMTGKQIFDKLQWAAHIYGPGSVEFMYGNLLFEALRMHGEEPLFSLLEEAERKGKKVALDYAPGDEQALTAPMVLR